MHNALPPPNSPQPRSASVANGNAKSVLVVEDDVDLRRIIVKALGKSYNVYEACDGADALLALDGAQAPDLIVSDVMMPKLDGFAMARQLKAHPTMSKIPIVFLTARDAAMDVVEGINAGARQYVTKPFKVNELVARVTKLLG
jgi:DNA-binding response OmpR family regulator